MGCGCKDRGTILRQAAAAARQGNIRQAAQRGGVVVRSMGQDAARLARQAAQARVQRTARR